MAKTFEDRLAALLAAWGKLESGSTAATITVGKLAHQAVRGRLGSAIEKARRALRAETLETIAAELRQAGHHATAADIARAVRIFVVSQCFGTDQAKRLAVRKLLAFAPLVRRDVAREEWDLSQKHATAARELFDQVVVEPISAEVISTRVNTIIGRKPRVPRAKPTPIQRILKLVQGLPHAQQVHLAHGLAQKLGLAFTAEAVEQSPEPKPPGIFGRRAAA